MTTVIGNIFRARDLPKYEAGQTLPPKNAKSNVAHLKQFEQLKNEHDLVIQEIDDNRESMIELERTSAEVRRELDEERRQLLLKRNTIEDQARQHIEAVFPNAVVTFPTPAPPDPATLDVVVEPPPLQGADHFEFPPTIPKSEDE